MAEEIEILRDLCDEYVLTNRAGEALVDVYCRSSWPMGDFTIQHPSVKSTVMVGLLPAVAMSAVAVNTNPARKTGIVGLLALVSVALAAWVRRWSDRGLQYS